MPHTGTSADAAASIAGPRYGLVAVPLSSFGKGASDRRGDRLILFVPRTEEDGEWNRETDRCGSDGVPPARRRARISSSPKGRYRTRQRVRRWCAAFISRSTLICAAA